jgi:hypothetical protein
MTVRPFAERDDGRVHGRGRRSLSDRLERMRRSYGFYCWLMCVFTVAGIALSRSLHGWSRDLFFACYFVVMDLWLAASILLLCRAVARWACGVYRPSALARRPESLVPQRAGDMNDRFAFDPGSMLPEPTPREMRGGLPQRREDNLPDVWRG